MYKGRTIAAVVPAYAEERLIGRVIETMPKFVDHIVVVDDCSEDRTADEVRDYEVWMDGRLHLICHEEHEGAGATIARDYESFGCSR